MALPVDVSKLLLLCGAPPEALVDYESGEPKKNREGEALYRTDIIVMGFGRPQVVGVRTPREPKGLVTGTPVSIPGFAVSTFSGRDGGTGVLYEATSVDPVKATRETS